MYKNVKKIKKHAEYQDDFNRDRLKAHPDFEAHYKELIAAEEALCRADCGNISQEAWDRATQAHRAISEKYGVVVIPNPSADDLNKFSVIQSAAIIPILIDGKDGKQYLHVRDKYLLLVEVNVNSEISLLKIETAKLAKDVRKALGIKKSYSESLAVFIMMEKDKKGNQTPKIRDEQYLWMEVDLRKGDAAIKNEVANLIKQSGKFNPEKPPFHWDNWPVYKDIYILAKQITAEYKWRQVAINLKLKHKIKHKLFFKDRTHKKDKTYKQIINSIKKDYKRLCERYGVRWKKKIKYYEPLTHKKHRKECPPDLLNKWNRKLEEHGIYSPHETYKGKSKKYKKGAIRYDGWDGDGNLRKKLSRYAELKQADSDESYDEKEE